MEPNSVRWVELSADLQLQSNTVYNYLQLHLLLQEAVLPGESMSIPFKLQNAGNREAGYSITSNFQGEGWVAYVTDENHSIVQMPIPLAKGESVNLMLNVTSPEEANPGEVPFSMRAVCPSCGGSLFGTDVISKRIEVPQLNSCGDGCRRMEIMAPANGNSRTVLIDLFNLG